MQQIPLQDVDSSQIAAIGYDAETNTLAVRFWRGSGGLARDCALGPLYHFANVTAAEFEAFLGAESKGKHFGAHIKPFKDRYPYEKVEDAPTPAAA